MATVTKTYTENMSSSYKATWVFTFTGNDISVTGSTFTVPLIAPTAKYTYSGKNKGEAYVRYNVLLNGIKIDEYGENGQWYEVGLASWASGATKTLVRNASYSQSISARQTSAYFTASNKTTRSIPLQYQAFWIYGYSCKGDIDTQGNGYNSQTISMDLFSPTLYATLNVPPTMTLGTPTYSSPQYAGLGTYSVPVTTATAYYGGDISSITLTVGSDTTTQSYSSSTVTNQTISVVPSVAGTYTPTITVTDSRGQTATETLAPITVNDYVAPNISFDLQRTNSSGVPNAEGEYGLITASISYTDAIANLTQPTVSVKDEGGNTILSSATWYTSWSAQSGVSSAVNWTNYNPQSPATLYAVLSATGSSFSINESYPVSITPTDNMGGVAQAITQTLSTGFFTIDFQAGGKEIAFGAPANDVLTSHPNGLFKCAMDAWFLGDVIGFKGSIVGEIKAYAGNTVPTGWLFCDGSEVPKADYASLYDAIGDVWGTPYDNDNFVLPNLQGRVLAGYDANDTPFDTVGKTGGVKDAVTPYHNHSVSAVTNGITGGAHTHPVLYRNTGVSSGSKDRLGETGDNKGSRAGAATSTTHTHNLPAHNTNYAGTSGNETNANLQPYAVIKYIICAE